MLKVFFMLLSEGDMLHYIYFTLAMFCFIGELFVFEFSLTCFGLGLLATAVAAWLGLGLGWQVLVFSAVSVASILCIRPLAHKFLYHRSQQVKTNVDALIGRVGVVTQEPSETDHIGRVQLDGDSWRALFKEHAPAQSKVRIQKVEGNTVFVVNIKQEEEK